MYIYVYIYVCDDDDDFHILTNDSRLYDQNYNWNILINN